MHLHSVVVQTTGWGLTALTDASVLSVLHDDLRRLATGSPAIAAAFWRETTVDASILAKWVANIGRKEAQARLAHFLCELGVRLEQAGLGRRDRFRLELTQEQIGDTIGLTSVHVNRTFQALRAQDLISLRAQMFEAHDWDRLARIAEFVPTYLLAVDPPPEQLDRRPIAR